MPRRAEGGDRQGEETRRESGRTPEGWSPDSWRYNYEMKRAERRKRRTQGKPEPGRDPKLETPLEVLLASEDVPDEVKTEILKGSKRDRSAAKEMEGR